MLTDDGFMVNSHPLFREVATPGELLNAPVLVNNKYLPNLAFMPYRNLKNLAEQAFPQLFGVAAGFDAQAYLGTGLDRTLGYRTADGEWVNGNQTRPAPELLAFAAEGIAAQRDGMRRVAWLPPDMAQAIGHAYLARIIALARAHGRASHPWLIAGYLGTSEAFDEAMVKFAVAYADQTERDHAQLKAAVAAGRIKVHVEEDR